MRVLAKDELFQDPEQRRKIDTLGGIPVFRPKDHGVRAAAVAPPVRCSASASTG